MIQGHGDDIYQYQQLRCNFSSNVSPLIDTQSLRDYLATRLEVIDHYPDPVAHPLECLLAAKHNVKPGEVLVTSGATDAIYLIAQTLRKEKTFAVKRPTFSEYADACRMFDYEETPKGGAVRWLCNPNNPTGEVCPWNTIEVLAKRHRWLVIDQSYEDYTSKLLPADQEYLDKGNIIVIHSMTKSYAIPGLRLGYIIAPEETIRLLRNNHRPWTVNALAIEAGLWLLRQQFSDYHEKMITLLAESYVIQNRLRSIFGIYVYPTTTNFMLCSIRQSSAATLKEYLLEHHRFLIRDASNFEGLKPCHFRIAVQEPDYNDELVDAIYHFTRLHT